jgi:hypothetical protein
MQAARLATSEFGGDMRELLDFLRWTWGREAGREDWRRKNAERSENARRLTWYDQFVRRTLLTDYKVATNRAAR